VSTQKNPNDKHVHKPAAYPFSSHASRLHLQVKRTGRPEVLLTLIRLMVVVNFHWLMQIQGLTQLLVMWNYIHHVVLAGHLAPSQLQWQSHQS
jgi:hypothetical protein